MFKWQQKYLFLKNWEKLGQITGTAGKNLFILMSNNFWTAFQHFVLCAQSKASQLPWLSFLWRAEACTRLDRWKAMQEVWAAISDMRQGPIYPLGMPGRLSGRRSWRFHRELWKFTSGNISPVFTVLSHLCLVLQSFWKSCELPDTDWKSLYAWRRQNKFCWHGIRKC